MNFKRMNKMALILLGGGGLLLVLLLAVPGLLRGDKVLDERHQPRAWNEPFKFEGTSFADYQQWAQRQLQQGLQTDALPLALAPQRLEPAADCPAAPDGRWLNGIVLTHDVQESPYQLRTLAEYFRARCFVVLLPLLPGHEDGA